MPSVVDLFCGIGGLTHGFIQEGGFNIVAGIDADGTCEYAYTANNPNVKFLRCDVFDYKSIDLSALFPSDDIKILVGCAPCQPFSRYSQPNREASRRDGKWKLLNRFNEFVQDVQPEIVSMENVPELVGNDVFHDFIGCLEENEYFIWQGCVECVRYGIPQTRCRLVLLASKFGTIELIPPTHIPGGYVTVEEAIGHLPPLIAGETDSSDPLHRASALTEVNLLRIKASRPGRTWRDWPDELKLDCHRKLTGKSFSSVYGRMDPTLPSPTMTTQCNGIGNGRFGHPIQDRAISIREAALLQTFPHNYDFIDPKTGFNFSNLARHIGNAVPVTLGRVIARSIARHLEDQIDN